MHLFLSWDEIPHLFWFIDVTDMKCTITWLSPSWVCHDCHDWKSYYFSQPYYNINCDHYWSDLQAISLKVGSIPSREVLSHEIRRATIWFSWGHATEPGFSKGFLPYSEPPASEDAESSSNIYFIPFHLPSWRWQRLPLPEIQSSQYCEIAN